LKEASTSDRIDLSDAKASGANKKLFSLVAVNFLFF